MGSARITATQEGNEFYTAATAVQQRLDVRRLKQVITFPDIPDKPFGTADFEPGATTNSPSAITYTSGNHTVATIVDGKIHITGVGTANITAIAPNPGNNYNRSAGVMKPLTVTKGIQTITFSGIPTKTYGTDDFEPGATTNSSSTITYSSSNADVATIIDGKIHITGVGNSIITASAAADANYEAAADRTQTLTVSKGVQTISFPTIPVKTYGTDDFEPGATTNASSSITYSSSNADVATIVDGKIHITGVGNSIITASAAADANYEAATNRNPNAKPFSKGGVQTITFPIIPVKPYGTDDFEPGATTNASSTITYSSSNADVATIIDGKIHITGVGNSIITASAAADANYNAAADRTQTLTVSKGIQTISFPTIPAKPYGTADFEPGATTNASSSITYSSSNADVATIVDEKIHITGAGTSTITASAATDAHYQEAHHVTQTLTVSKATQTISINMPSLTVGGDSYIAKPTGGNSRNPVVLTTTSTKISISGFTITPIQAGRAQISATQSGNSNYDDVSTSINFCVNPQKPVVTKIAYNILSSSEANGNQWFLDKVQITGATSQTLMTAESGNYSVTTTLEGCISLHSDPFIYTGDVSKLQDELLIYPNPASSKLHVVLGGFDIHSEANISIYNLLGISLFNKISVDSQIVTIPTSFLPNGSYIILVTQRDKRSSKLFFKN